MWNTSTCIVLYGKEWGRRCRGGLEVMSKWGEGLQVHCTIYYYHTTILLLLTLLRRRSYRCVCVCMYIYTFTHAHRKQGMRPRYWSNPRVTATPTSPVPHDRESTELPLLQHSRHRQRWRTARYLSAVPRKRLSSISTTLLPPTVITHTCEIIILPTKILSNQQAAPYNNNYNFRHYCLP